MKDVIAESLSDRVYLFLDSDSVYDDDCSLRPFCCYPAEVVGYPTAFGLLVQLSAGRLKLSLCDHACPS